MKVDRNFMVVTALLSGLLIWSLVRKPEQQPQQLFILPGEDPMEWGEEEVVLPRDPTAQQIMEYIGEMGSKLINYRREVDKIFLGEDNPWRSTSDLERDAPKWFQAYQDLYRLCAQLQDEFKQLQVQLNEEFGEQEWVAANLNIIQLPFETRQALDGYKSGSTYQQVYVHRLTVAQNQGTRPQTQQDHINLNANQRHNEYGDDYGPGGGSGKARDVFSSVPGGDSMDLDKASKMVQDTTSNPQLGTGAANRTLANDDAYDTLNADGALGGGNLGDRAADTDMRDLDKKAKKAKKDTASGHSSLLNASGYSQAQTSNATDNIPTHPYQTAPNEQITANTKRIDALVKKQTEEANRIKEQAAKDSAQDLSVKDTGGIPKGIPVSAATYVPPPATSGEANETDAVERPKPKPVPRSTEPSLAQAQSLPGFEKVGEKRGRDPFVAVVTPQEKKSKPSPAVVPPEPEEEDLDLTGGTKREGVDPELGPESRGDVEASENVPQQLTEPTTGTVTDEPLSGRGVE